MCGYEVTFAPFPPTVQKTTKINFQDYGPDKLINTTKDLYKTAVAKLDFWTLFILNLEMSKEEQNLWSDVKIELKGWHEEEFFIENWSESVEVYSFW